MKLFSIGRLLVVMLALIIGAGMVACGDDDDDDAGVTATTSGGGTEPTDEPAEPDPGVSANTIKVGATSALTGVAAAVCNPPIDAVKAWFDKINEDGGVNGRQIEYTTYDDELDAQRGLSNARRMVEQDGVFAIVGGCGSQVAGPIAEYVDEQGVPYIGHYAALETFLFPVRDEVFSLLPLYHQQLAASLPWAFEEYGEGSFALASFGDSPATQEAMNAIATEFGVEYKGLVTYQTGQPDFAPVITRLRELNPDYVLFTASATDGARLVTQMGDQNYKPPKKFIGTAVVSDSTFLTNVSDWANGLVIGSSPVALPGTPDAASCEEVLGAEGTHFTLYGCAVAQLFTNAVEMLGDNPTRAGLIELLQDSSQHVPVDPIPGGETTVRPNDQLLNSSVIMFAIEGGALVTLTDEPVAIP